MRRFATKTAGCAVYGRLEPLVRRTNGCASVVARIIDGVPAGGEW